MVTLALEQERRLTAYTKRKQKPIERILDELIPNIAEEEDEEEYAKPVGLQDQFASEEELEKWFDELAEIGRGWGSLPNSAFERENIYEDRI